MEQPIYKHYIITRFNLKQNDWTRDKNNNALSATDAAWLKERFSLFERYCLPSVKAQTCQDFTWLVYFDTDTPENYKEKIEGIRSGFPNFVPKFIPSMSYLLTNIREYIEADNTANITIITTRLDNDDSLHECFVQSVQSLVKRRSVINAVIDIPNGYCLQIKPVPMLSTTIQHSNAFVSYIEPYTSSGDLLTVMGKAHGKWAYSVKTYVIRKSRLWMQIIHENNVVNRIQGIVTSDEKQLAGFNLAEPIVLSPVNFSQRMINNWIKKPFYIIKKKSKDTWTMRRLIFKK